MNWNTTVPQFTSFAPNLCSNVDTNNNMNNNIINSNTTQPPISSEAMNNCFTNAVMMNANDINVVSAPYATNSPSIGSGGSNFGIVVPGKPVNTMIEMVDNTRWTANIGVAPENFMIFMIDATAWLPNEFGIGVYLARCDDMLFQYLGSLTHTRPSALFKTPASFFTNEHTSEQLSSTLHKNLTSNAIIVNNNNNSNSNNNNSAGSKSSNNNSYTTSDVFSAHNVNVVVGLSIEKLDILENLGITQQQPLQATEAMTRNGIAERLLEDLYNFLMSYARCVPPQQMLHIPEGEDHIVLPASFVNKWRERVQKKILKDSGFLAPQA